MLKLLGLLIVSCYVTQTRGCSCAQPRVAKQFCSDHVQYVIRLTITEIQEKAVSEIEQYTADTEAGDDDGNPFYNPSKITYPTPQTSSSSSSSVPYYERMRTVNTNITHFYKGEGEIGKVMTLSSGMDDGMCGIGYSLQPDTEWILFTNNLDHLEVALCMFMFRISGDWYYQEKQEIVENIDCTCKPAKCKLREGRRVFRGLCHDPNAYCAKDEDGTCRWNNAESIETCRTKSWW